MIGGLAACVAVTMVVVSMAMLATDRARDASSPTGTWVSGVPTTEVDLSSLTTTRHLSAVARSTHDSTVALLVERSGHTTVRTGIVAEAGGIVVALAPSLTGAGGITVVEPDGTASRRSWSARTQPPGSASFASATTCRPPRSLPPTRPRVRWPWSRPRSPDTVTTATPAVRLYAGTVLFAGVAPATGRAGHFSSTGVQAPLTVGDLGSPLVDTSGAVCGILDTVQGTGRNRTSVFLPAELVRDVTDQIVSRGWVDHGSLGVLTSDLPPTSGLQGAEVRSVTGGGAGDEAGLRSGDVLVGVDGHSVRSVAELDTRLYGDPPGSELRVTVDRDGTTFDTMVVLTDA